MGSPMRSPGGPVDILQLAELMGLCVPDGPIGHTEMEEILRRYRGRQEEGSVSVTPVDIVQWKPWYTITALDERVACIERLENKLGHYVRSRLVNVTVAAESREITLARGTLAQLGFTENPMTKQFLGDANRLARYGLELLPAEAGLCLRDAYQDQPLWESLWVGMDPILDSGAVPGVFRVDHGADGRWLDSSSARPRKRWFLQSEWVFAVASK